MQNISSNIIHKTSDYEKFKFIDENRGIKLLHVEKLKKALARRNKLDYYPIVVDKNYYVIDGQHRLIAAKELNLPIYYIIDENATKDDMVDVNAVVKVWTLEDFRNYYIKMGVREYIEYEKMMKKYDIMHSVLYNICFSDKGESSYAFRYGKVKIPEHAEKLLELFDETHRFLRTNIHQDKQKLLRQKYFWRALTRFYKVLGEKTFKKLCEVLKMNVYNLVFFGRSEDWINFFCEIYNKQYCRGTGSKNKLSLSMFT